MTLGKKSLLFGVHQFIWHPLTVLIAWCVLYGRPSWREVICIWIHDWGYWFCSDMDGPEGKRHPEFAAQLAGRWLGPIYRDLCLYHSRHYSESAGKLPSRLCWADKMSVKYDPWWFYIFRAWLSGELREYRDNSSAEGLVPKSAKHKEWHMHLRNIFISQAKEEYMKEVY